MDTIVIDADQIQAAMSEDLRAFVIAANVELQSRIIDKAPVDTGALRGSIRVGLNRRNEVFGPLDPSGERTKALNESTLEGYKLGDEVIITAGAPYAQYLEYGTDKIAPIAFAQRSLNEWATIAKIAATKMKKYITK